MTGSQAWAGRLGDEKTETTMGIIATGTCQRHGAGGKRGTVNYAAYLQSDRWKRMRTTLLANVQCFGCRRQPAHELHHTTYQTLGHESWKDVVPLCRLCHETLHRALRKRWPLSSVGKLAEWSPGVWPMVFGMSLHHVRREGNWKHYFTTAFPRGTAQSKGGRKKASKKERRRRRTQRHMAQNRAYHERMCNR